ncbi:hypothetical protein [Chryseobacterium nepalense]|uniref:hypothetical protein n=1 Tax=Chryseobacterium nepalense TaxID=1854498 RepID=UPI002E01837B|nr:hypothetical protein [Chryseobacterium nepalense]
MQTFIALLSFKNEIKIQNEGSFAILIASLLLPFPDIRSQSRFTQKIYRSKQKLIDFSE